jgi:sulfatase maturation enzyme AslB (radical SAM superfamily)
MSLSTARNAADFAPGLISASRRVDFSFVGGEPVLCFDHIVEIVRCIRERQLETGQPILLSITSNGMLLAEPIRALLAVGNPTGGDEVRMTCNWHRIAQVCLPLIRR